LSFSPNAWKEKLKLPFYEEVDSRMIGFFEGSVELQTSIKCSGVRSGELPALRVPETEALTKSE
jgi:hypothetical protein